MATREEEIAAQAARMRAMLADGFAPDLGDEVLDHIDPDGSKTAAYFDTDIDGAATIDDTDNATDDLNAPPVDPAISDESLLELYNELRTAAPWALDALGLDD